jgi:hypothetical protein
VNEDKFMPYVEMLKRIKLPPFAPPDATEEEEQKAARARIIALMEAIKKGGDYGQTDTEGR